MSRYELSKANCNSNLDKIIILNNYVKIYTLYTIYFIIISWNKLESECAEWYPVFCSLGSGNLWHTVWNTHAGAGMRLPASRRPCCHKLHFRIFDLWTWAYIKTRALVSSVNPIQHVCNLLHTMPQAQIATFRLWGNAWRVPEADVRAKVIKNMTNSTCLNWNYQKPVK